MIGISATAQDLALSAFVRIRNCATRLTAWAEANVENGTDERGSYSTEMVVIIAVIEVLDIAVIVIVAKKVLN